MLSVILICMVLGTASAEELDANTLEGFQGMFYGKVMQHLNVTYHVLQPVIQRHNQSMEQCMTRLTAAKDTCKTCATSRCQNTGNWFENQLGSVANWAQGAGGSFAGWQGWQDMGNAFGDVGNWFAGAGDSFLNWGGWGDMGNVFSDIGSGIGNFFGDVGSTLGSGFNSFTNFMGGVGSDVGGAFNDLGSSIGSLFGRRRRRSVGGLEMTARRVKMLRNRYMAKRMEELSPEARQCMGQCSECTPFLGDENAMIGGVCGDQILLDQANIADMGRAMKELHDANGSPQQGTLPILRKVEFDRSTLDFATFTCSGVYITAETPNGVIRYASVHRYNFLDTRTTAGELAMELIEKWEV